jgi:virginiamycin A acetyltransferase
MRETLKRLARGAATAAILPRLLAYKVMAAVIGPDHALEGATQSLARVPGLRGEYLRRAFLSHTLAHCDPTATICWGTVLSKAGAVIGRNAYVGAGCHLGLVLLEQDVLLASGVHIPSGAQTHGMGDPSIPIREQPGEIRVVRVGQGSWIGSAAIVMADVGRDSVVAAGSVVTKPLPDAVIAGGVPARVIRSRLEGQPG